MTRNILAIGPGVGVPGKGNTGAGLRIDGLLGRLEGSFEVSRCDVKTLLDGLQPRPRPPERRRFLARRPAWAPTYSAADRRRIRDRLRRVIDDARPDLLWLGHGTTAAALAPARQSALGPGIPTVIDAYDLLWTALDRRLEAAGTTSGLRRLRNQVEVARARHFEHRLYGRADQVWVCSELDRRRLCRELPLSKVRVVANFFEPPSPEPPPAPPDDGPVLFVGTMGYYPNRQGMEWFLHDVWPRVIERRPHTRLQVVGHWPEWTSPSPIYDQPGVEVLGFVDDLEPVWAEASMLVCPLRVGSGTRIKILEAWARRVPVVSTGIGIEGLDAEPDVHACLTDDPETMAATLVELADDAEARRRLAYAGHGLWFRRYSLDRAAGRAIEACRSLLGEPAETAL